MLLESICNKCNHKQSIEVDVKKELFNQANQRAEKDNEKKLAEIIASQAAIDESKAKVEEAQKEIDKEIKAGIESNQKAMAEQIRKEITLEESKKAKNDAEKIIKASTEAATIEAEKMARIKWQKILDDSNTKNDKENRLLKTQFDQVQKGLNDANRKVNQTSMQIQGAAGELETLEWLQRQFTYDDIQDTKNGADISHIVLSNGKPIGRILYEVKNTQNWSNDWPTKLKFDMQEVNADIGVIVSEILPKEYLKYGISQGVYICSPSEAKALSHVFRQLIINHHRDIKDNNNNNELRDILWKVVTGSDFQKKLLAIYDAFKVTQEITITDKKYHNRKWIKLEKQENLIISNLLSLYGLLQDETGNALKEVAGLDYKESLDE
jgi:hypothetical protein